MKILCIDGNSILNRAFYGIKILTTKKGVHTNGIFGFLNILFRIENNLNPDAVAICFDLPKKTFRHKKYPDYKGTRKSMPQELRDQFPILKNLLRDLGYKIVELEGYEADDILGTFSKTCIGSDNECIIMTGDKDNLQLIDDNTKVMLATNKGTANGSLLVDEIEFSNMYGGLRPKQLIDLKALMGDSSDNIPGVSGIGEKTALKYIQKYSNLDGVYENIDDSSLIKPAAKNKLIEEKDKAYLSYELATIFCDVPVDVNIDSYIKNGINEERIIEQLSDLEMFTFLDKLGLDSNGIKNDIETISIITHIDDLNYKFSTEETLNLLYNGDYVTLSQNNDIYLYTKDVFDTISKDILTQYTVNIFSSKKIYNYCYAKNFIPKKIDFDMEIAGYLDDASSTEYTLTKMANSYFINLEINYDKENSNEFKNHILFVELSKKLKRLLDEKELTDLYYNVELPLAKVLFMMEIEGISVNVDDIKSFGEMLKAKIGELTTTIYAMSGCEFNINSPKQLGEILFSKMGLTPPKKTKTGYSTNADVLELLRGDNPIIDSILEYRTYSKLNSTYVEGLLKLVKGDNTIHTTFNQLETRTGRISSIEPNLQNIPVRTELGSQMRKFFKARDGYVFVDADYSQIELRVLADISNDANMIKAFKSGEDIHLNTASQVFNIPKDMVTPHMRSSAKAVNFGIVYGISSFSLSKDIKVTVKEAGEYIENYLNTFVGVKKYMENTINFAKEHGYVLTMFKRRRYLPEMSSSNKNIQGFGKRVAMNMPIQGTAADIIKISMINVYNRLEKEKLDAKLILQVHDELIVECKKNISGKVKKLLKEEMENAVKLSVHLDVDVNVGENWYVAKG